MEKYREAPRYQPKKTNKGERTGNLEEKLHMMNKKGTFSDCIYSNNLTGYVK